MALKPILLKAPVEVAAVEAKSFPIMWLLNLQTRTPGPDAGSAYIEVAPMSATGEIYGPGREEFSTQELWAARAEVKSVAAAFDAIIEALPDLIAWIKSRQEKQEQPDGLQSVGL